jgi:hypothetical protein
MIQYGPIGVGAPYADLPFHIPYGSVAHRAHDHVVAPLDLLVRLGAKLLYRFVMVEIEGSRRFVPAIGLLWTHLPNRFRWNAVLAPSSLSASVRGSSRAPLYSHRPVLRDQT